jgi:predicted O-methyltransferase YrrM
MEGTVPEYRSTMNIPELVKRAKNLAEQRDCQRICSDQAGKLLQLLASQLPSGVIGEVGTGCGVAASWIVSALSSSTSFFTVDGDLVAAATAKALFEPLLNVRVVHGDWREFLENWRFALLYAKPDTTRAEEPELFLRALRNGGMIVIDGLTPIHRLPLELRDRPDPVRDFWLKDTRLLSIEIMVSAEESVLLATLVS